MKPQKNVSVVKEYVHRLFDDELNLIVDRLTQPVCGDRADVSLLFEKDKDLDRWLCQAKGAFEWFDKIDIIEDYAVAEQSRRQKSNQKK